MMKVRVDFFTLSIYSTIRVKAPFTVKVPFFFRELLQLCR